MSFRPTTCTRSTPRTVGMLALATAAVFAAVAPGLLLSGSQVSNVVASAEMATGAALQAQNSWIVPAVFTVMVFAMVVGGTIALTWTPAPHAPVAVRSQSNDRIAPIAFELREPERALAVRLDRLPGFMD